MNCLYKDLVSMQFRDSRERLQISLCHKINIKTTFDHPCMLDLENL